MTTNFGDFQNGVYADAVKGKLLDIPSISSLFIEKRLRPSPTGCTGTFRRRPGTDGRNGLTLRRIRTMESCPG
jgi:hypothetical protein